MTRLSRIFWNCCTVYGVMKLYSILTIVQGRDSSDADFSTATVLNLQWYDLVLTSILFLKWTCRSLHLSDEGVKVLSSYFHNLTALDLSFCEKISDRGLHELVANNAGLTTVNLTGCKRLTDKSMKTIALYTDNLDTVCIQMTNVTDIGLQHMCRNVRSLRGLWPTPQHKHTSDCDNVTLLDLSIASCMRVSNVGIQIIAEHGKHLRRLDLSGCTFNDSAFCQCPIASLTSFPGNIMDIDMEDICKACFMLQHLYLRTCKMITDTSVGKIIRLSKLKANKRLPALNTIDVGG